MPEPREATTPETPNDPDTETQPETQPETPPQPSAADEVARRVEALEATAAALRDELARSERERRIDRELLARGVVAIDEARGLVGPRVEGGASIAEAVAEVRRRRPGLFGPGPSGLRATAAPAREEEPGARAEALARVARQTGDRASLVRYLRTRRQTC
jgi:hypothetical protein